MALDVTTQAQLLTDKLMQMAVGTLYKRLGFVQLTQRWRTNSVMENGDTFNVPILGTVASNTRAPGAQVTDTTETPSRRTVTITERETSWLVDPTWSSSEGIRFQEQRIISRTNQLAQDVMDDILETVATQAGPTSVGTLGVALTKANMDTARKTLSDGSIPDVPRIAVVSTDMMEDLNNIPEYSDFEKLGTAGVHADGIVGRAAGFMLMESPYVHSPAGGQHQGFACWPESITTVFPMQEVFNRGSAVKSESDIDGLRLYLLREHAEKQNGAERWTLSMRFGSLVNRDEGLVQLLGR